MKAKHRAGFGFGLGLGLGAGVLLTLLGAGFQSNGWPWDGSLDATIAAPDSHVVLFENERVRVLRVSIEPGEKEPAHTHRSPSVMILHRPSRIRYFDADGEVQFESPPGRREATGNDSDWLEPEGLHAVENIDEVPYEAYRVELKD